MIGVLLASAGCASGPVRRRGTPPPTAAPSATVATDPTQAPATPAPAGSTAGVVSPGDSTAPVVELTPGEPAPQPVDLVRSDGTPFQLAGEQGHPTILFFGYTHCPDVCPETIATLLEVQRARPDMHVVFVTVDPERDTPEFLAQWVEYMPAGVIGVTGSPAAIKRAADMYGVQYARVDTGSVGGYSMAHTAFQYLIDKDGVLVRVYPFATSTATILEDMASLS